MFISDLDYLETAEANVVGGYFFGLSSSTTTYQNLSISTGLNSATNVKGTFAGAEANAGAIGPNTSTQALTFTNAVQGVGSSSSATSVSATNGASYTFCWPR